MSLSAGSKLEPYKIGAPLERPRSEECPRDKSPSNIVDIVLRFAVPLGFDSLRRLTGEVEASTHLDGYGAYQAVETR
jgi:hypothetical protein